MENQKKEKFLNVPNCLSLLRMALIPVYWILYFNGYAYWAVVTFVVASLTDLVDGYIARRFNLITKYGKVLDPLADKLMQLSALLSLTITGDVHWLITGLSLGKELYMIIGGAWLYNKHVVVYSNIFGKTATMLLSSGLSLALLAKAFESLALTFHGTVMLVAQILLIAGTVASLTAGVIYTVSVVKSLKGKISDDKEQNEKIDLSI